LEAGTARKCLGFPNERHDRGRCVLRIQQLGAVRRRQRHRMHGRIHLAGIDHKEAHSPGAEFLGPNPTEMIEARLRNRVGPPARVSDDCGVGADVDDETLVACGHGPGDGLRETKWTKKVGGKHLFQILTVGVEELWKGRSSERARIVDQKVERADEGGCGPHQRVDRLLVRDIGRNSVSHATAFADLEGHLLEGFPSAGNENDLGTLKSELPGESRTQALAAAGDEGRGSLYLHCSPFKSKVTPGRQFENKFANTLSDDYSVVMSELSKRLAGNVHQLREARGLTQEQMSKLAGIPRATWSHLESGSGNPTLSVLHKVAGALQVPLEELISIPRAACQFYRRASLPTQTRGEVLLRKLLPDAVPGMEIDRMELPPRARMTGVPHTPGTREYLTCETGEIALAVAGEKWRLEPGDVVVFRGDQRHSYTNPGIREAVGYSVVVLAPPVG